uniref:Elongator complex protein 6 n=1 Tax=Erpetoichthys calabaricus TaxID=27687 RepID=A0A8C4XF33_ERPCA
MFAELNGILNWSLDKFEKGQCVLLSESKTDGSFLIHHFLSFFLKAQCKVCFLGLVQSFSHYSTVGINMLQAREKGQLVFFEGLRNSLDMLLPESDASDAEPQPLSFLRWPSTDLRNLFDFVNSSLSQSENDMSRWASPVLLIDDLSVLLSLGVNPTAVLDFIHYCRMAVCSKQQGNMVTLVHNEDDLGDEDCDLVLHALTHQSSLILQVHGLNTGYCRDVHGQVLIKHCLDHDATLTHSLTHPLINKYTISHISYYLKFRNLIG